MDDKETMQLVANLDHVSTQWVQLHQAISEALGLEFEPNEDIERYAEAIANLHGQIEHFADKAALTEWAIETSKVWVNFLNTTDQDAPPSEALCDTLNVLTDKVNTYERELAIKQSK